ncbi:MAG: hypothetical protein Q9192_001588 [Flavoplaca navasiana]
MVSDITDASLDSLSADRLREVCKSVGLRGGRGNESEEHMKKGIRLVRDRKPHRDLDDLKDGQSSSARTDQPSRLFYTMLIYVLLAWAKWGHLGIEAWDELSRKIDFCMVGGMVLSLIGYIAYHYAPSDSASGPMTSRLLPIQHIDDENGDDTTDTATVVGHGATAALRAEGATNETPGIRRTHHDMRSRESPISVAGVEQTSHKSAPLPSSATLQSYPVSPPAKLDDATVQIQDSERKCEKLLVEPGSATMDHDAQGSQDQPSSMELGKRLEEACSRAHRAEADLKEQQQLHRQELLQQRQELLQQHQELSNRHQWQSQENKSYRRELFDLRKSVWTVARIRPRIVHDLNREKIDVVLSDPFKHRRSLILRKEHNIDRLDADREYDFDRVFHEQDTNSMVSLYVKPMVQAAAEDGLNAAILVEGPSGSGKSYTLFGQNDSIAFWMAKYLFEPRDLEGELPPPKIRLYGLKVYQDLLYDALDRQNKHMLHISNETPLRIYHDQQFKRRFEGNEVFSTLQLTTALRRIYGARDERRTEQNETSSRGHTICMLEFHRQGSIGGNSATSLLFLVDLAGPEPIAQSQHQNETKSITKSRTELQCRLRDMVNLYAPNGKSAKEGAARQTLRLALKNSPLTNILRDCFLGEPRMVIIATINPYTLPEYRSKIKDTLEFVKQIRDGPPKPKSQLPLAK